MNRRALSAVLPGLPQLLSGRWGGGATALLAGCPKYAPMRIHTEANPRVDLGL